MKKINVLLIILLFLGVLALGSHNAIGSPEGKGSIINVMAKPSVVPLDKKGKVIFMGSGYNPGQKITLLFKTPDGATADISYALDPEPVANDVGSWVTVWSYGRFVAKKLIKQGAYAILITDLDYNILASAPICFLDTKKPEKEWPNWGRLAIGK